MKVSDGCDYETLYRDALAADEAFSKECMRQFGKNYGEMRYRPFAFDYRTKAACEQFKISTQRLWDFRRQKL